MTFKELSPKQRQVFTWPYTGRYRAVICDGAVRSGKTICMVTSFILWAMKKFSGATFGICGKTVASAERNIIGPLIGVIDLTRLFRIKYSPSRHLLTVENSARRNSFYVFGGKDEASAALIQGITLSGVLFDEVALMPRSFVQQAMVRCISVSGALLWFNCNPDSPSHWFYEEWISKPEDRGALYLHFLMSDNPIMTPEKISQASAQFSGIFYDRFILGQWVAAQGLVYRFGEENITDQRPAGARYVISVDYGTHNPFSAGLWSVTGMKAVRIKEFYWSSKKEGFQKTDEEYCDAIQGLAEGYRIDKVIVDPSAASFIEALHRRGMRAVRARNDVLTGIRRVSSMLSRGMIKIHRSCVDSIREFSLYCWNDKAGSDAVVKENDHAMDDIRYFVSDLCGQDGAGFFEVVKR